MGQTQDRLAAFYRWMASLETNSTQQQGDLVVIMLRNARDKLGLDFLAKHPKRKNSR